MKKGVIILMNLFQIAGTEWWKFLLDTYIIWLVVLFLVKIIFSNSRFLNFIFLYLILFVIYQVSIKLDLAVTTPVFKYIVNWYPIALIVIMAPDLRRVLEFAWKKDLKNEVVIMGNESTRVSVVEAAFELSKNNIGALITIEKHNTLDQYADRAIMMDSLISKELLMNIFIPNSPLHDGAVLIRGDHILCAGAYFILSEREVEDKTMGSRHRAALGISEATDSLTIVVSEETGKVSIAVEGILLRMNDKDKLMEYLSMFMR